MMTESVLLAMVGALQAIGLGYLEVIRRTTKKCGAPACLLLIRRELERTSGVVAVSQSHDSARQTQSG